MQAYHNVCAKIAVTTLLPPLTEFDITQRLPVEVEGGLVGWLWVDAMADEVEGDAIKDRLVGKLGVDAEAHGLDVEVGEDRHKAEEDTADHEAEVGGRGFKQLVLEVADKAEDSEAEVRGQGS